MLRAIIANFERTDSMASEKVNMKIKQKIVRMPENITVTRTVMKSKAINFSQHMAQQLGVRENTLMRIDTLDN